MVEAGGNVCEMGVMTKELRANWFHSEYISIIAEIPDTRFEDDSLRAEAPFAIMLCLILTSKKS
jgi:hypothetical protein